MYICSVLQNIEQRIFEITDQDRFEHPALEIFRYQAIECKVYAAFIRNLGIQPENVSSLGAIPFLPVSFFKTHTVICGNEDAEIVFTSSATTGSVPSGHYVKDLGIYRASFRKAFELFYGDISDYAVLALLPSYLEREGSSLIYMAEDLIKQSGHPSSGFFLHNHHDLHQRLGQLKASSQKTILIGVSYALLDFIDAYPIQFPELIVMETGGMKGKRKELIKEELHRELCRGFGVQAIHSEYGMTELLSQAYSYGHGIYRCPPWMQVLTSDPNDPLSLLPDGASGGINIIDLANIHSCSFIATQDLGIRYPDGSFTILGRFDQSDIRGCNLMVQ